MAEPKENDFLDEIDSAEAEEYAEDMAEIDEEAVETDDPATLNTLNAELADLDREIAHLNVPLTYQGYAYNARLHIDLLRKKIANRMA